MPAGPRNAAQIIVRSAAAWALALGCACVAEFPDRGAPPLAVGEQDEDVRLVDAPDRGGAPVDGPAAAGASDERPPPPELDASGGLPGADAEPDARALLADAAHDAVPPDPPPPDPPPPDPPPDAASPEAGGADAGPPDAAPGCEPRPCFGPAGQPGVSACADARLAECGPGDWQFCTCSNHRHPVLFFDAPPESGAPLGAITLAVQSQEPVALTLDGACVGRPAASCRGRAPCGTFVVHEWSDLPRAAPGAERVIEIHLGTQNGGCPVGEPPLVSMAGRWM